MLKFRCVVHIGPYHSISNAVCTLFKKKIINLEEKKWTHKICIKKSTSCAKRWKESFLLLKQLKFTLSYAAFDSSNMA